MLVTVGVCVDVCVGVSVGVEVSVGVCVEVSVGVCVGVSVGVDVTVGVGVGVGVGGTGHCCGKGATICPRAPVWKTCPGVIAPKLPFIVTPGHPSTKN